MLHSTQTLLHICGKGKKDKYTWTLYLFFMNKYVSSDLIGILHLRLAQTPKIDTLKYK